MLKSVKAQSTEFIILMVVGLIAAVLVILAVSGVFTKVSDVPGALPGTLTVAAQACQFSADQNDKVGYCNDFKEVRIGGDLQWINCDFIKKKYNPDGLKDFNVECVDVDAGGESLPPAKHFCWQLNNSQGSTFKADKVIVNSVTCAKHLE